MKNLRIVLWLAVVATFTVAVLVPVYYRRAAAQLPTVESELDLERLMRSSVEGQRKPAQVLVADKEHLPIDFARPDFTKLPKQLVAATLTEWGCPGYFQTPKERGWPWLRRLVSSFFKDSSSGAEGACELRFSVHLAERLGVADELALVLMAHRLHDLLSKDALVAYDLETTVVDDGVVGLDDAAGVLFKKPLSGLNLSEQIQLAVALPPDNMWREFVTCHNGALIQRVRDQMLTRLLKAGLLENAEAQAAFKEPVACNPVKPKP